MTQRVKLILAVLVLLVAITLGACASDVGADPATATHYDTVSTLTSQPTAATPTTVPAPPPTSTATATPPAVDFSGEKAYDRVEAQLAFGPRWPGSPGHREVADYIVGELEALGWDVERQRLDYRGVEGQNLIARANIDAGDVIIIGAHYDTRRIADQSAGESSGRPVPGAVDGASGVAVLLELARVLELEDVPREIWLTFFDFEDNGGGGLPGWDWIVGSSYMAANLTIEPEAMVLVDMVGDADQQLYYEGNSDPELRQHIWAIAEELGFEAVFVPEVRHTMIDDHVPFARQGIAAIDIIDFDYPYWHTVEDTADKVSAESLERVGRTLEYWLEEDISP